MSGRDQRVEQLESVAVNSRIGRSRAGRVHAIDIGALAAQQAMQQAHA